jgi:hypothetical protein
MAEGAATTRKLILLFSTSGVLTVFTRHCLETTRFPTTSLETFFQKFLNVRVLIALAVCTVFLPAQPWRHMTSTLLYDIVSTITSVIVVKNVRDSQEHCGPIHSSNPLGNLNYDPMEDPYYISNLESPVIDFIEEALEECEFRHIVHIVLESMRADCFPLQEDGLLATYVKGKYKPAEAELTTANVTPFITTLAENMIMWETVWATIPFTHKAMLGRIINVFCIFNFRLLWAATITG